MSITIVNSAWNNLDSITKQIFESNKMQYIIIHNYKDSIIGIVISVQYHLTTAPFYLTTCFKDWLLLISAIQSIEILSCFHFPKICWSKNNHFQYTGIKSESNPAVVFLNLSYIYIYTQSAPKNKESFDTSSY